MKKKNKRNENNHKKIVILIVILLTIIIILSSVNVVKNKLTTDERHFKNEYEKFNGEKDSDGNYYIDVNIKEDNDVDYLDGKAAVKFMKSGTGILYFGFPQCSWCRSAIEVLIDAKEEMEIDKIYYYNAYGARDEKYLDEEGNIITLHSGSEYYYEILELLGEKADIYEGLNDKNIKRLYFPTVVFIKDGKVMDIRVSTVESNKDENKKLTKKEYNELKEIYIESIKKIK